jgi:hypothetical protein
VQGNDVAATGPYALRITVKWNSWEVGESARNCTFIEITPCTAGVTLRSIERVLLLPLRDGGKSKPRLELTSKGTSQLLLFSTQASMPMTSTNKGKA